MKKEIEKIISNFSGTVGVIIKSKEKEEVLINESEVFTSASLIKLFIAFTIEKNIYKNKVKIKDEYKVGGCGVLKNLTSDLELSIRDLMALMLCFSDNTATNILIDYLGMDNINKKIKEAGFENTILGRKMLDNLAKEKGKDNYTTPKEVSKVLELLCQDNEIVEMLKNQGYNNKINTYFTREDNLKFAHKTGELKYVEHDAGRLYFNGKWVDIIIMTKDLLNNGDGIKINNLLGELVINKILAGEKNGI